MFLQSYFDSTLRALNMDKIFLFDSNNLYQDSLHPEKVVPLQLECYDVRYAGRNFVGTSTIEFKIVGRGDTVYKTSYPWALVLKTEENLRAVERRNSLRARADLAERRACEAQGQLINAGTVLGLP